MERFLLIVATGFGFLITIGLANLIVPILFFAQKNQPVQKAKRQHKGVSWRASKKGIPTMGGLCIVFASLLSIVAVDVGLNIGESEIIITSWTQQVTLTVMVAFMFGAIGMADDAIRMLRNQPAGLPEFVKFMLQAAAVGISLLLYWQYGYLSTATILPVFGYTDLGGVFYPLSYLFALFFVRSVDKTDGVDGLCSSCAFISVLGLLVFSVTLGSFEGAVFPAALAGSLLAFLFWNFYPAKISMGSTGSLFLAGAMLAMAQALNWPGLLWVIGLPYFIEGVFSLVQFVWYLCTGKHILAQTPLYALMMQKGWSQTGLIYLFSSVSVLGVMFAMLLVRMGEKGNAVKIERRGNCGGKKTCARAKKTQRAQKTKNFNVGRMAAVSNPNAVAFGGIWLDFVV